MHRYYLSLCRGLVGYYVLFEAPDEATVRRHAAEYFGRMWCSVYDEEYFANHIMPNCPHTILINVCRPIVLESWEWE